MANGRVRTCVSIGPVSLTLNSAAVAQDQLDLEQMVVARYCPDMRTEVYFPDRTHADCMSGTHVIEVDFSGKWAEAIGQVLHYSLWTTEISKDPQSFAPRFRLQTPKRPGIIFVCRADRTKPETCADHVVRPFRIAEHFGIPLTMGL